ncbi:hypothetical protein [Flavobacterium sp.]
MEPEDKIFDQFKAAANKAETKEFPAMDKVWNRVEDKLDHKILTKQNTLWKKLAVAASVLLVASIGYQFLKDDNKMVVPNAEIVTIDPTKTIIDTINPEGIVQSEIVHPAIKPNAEIILQDQIADESSVVVTDTVKKKATQIYFNGSADKKESTKEELQIPAAAPILATSQMPKNNYEARGVVQNGYENAKAAKQTMRKDEPLLVIDNKAKDMQSLGKLDPNDVDSIMVLPDPLYIINGIEYTEKELFGPNPMSPYSPLNKQEIETLSILQNEKATSIYGDKGKKGVVIITTKGGKPAVQKTK